MVRRDIKFLASKNINFRKMPRLGIVASRVALELHVKRVNCRTRLPITIATDSRLHHAPSQLLPLPGRDLFQLQHSSTTQETHQSSTNSIETVQRRPTAAVKSSYLRTAALPLFSAQKSGLRSSPGSRHIVQDVFCSRELPQRPSAREERQDEGALGMEGELSKRYVLNPTLSRRSSVVLRVQHLWLHRCGT
jgi:hypothetical protein